MNKLKLPINLTPETAKAIGRTYGNMGSITLCESKEDFGRYRFVLVQEFDKEIRKLKKKKCH